MHVIHIGGDGGTETGGSYVTKECGGENVSLKVEETRGWGFIFTRQVILGWSNNGR